LRMVPFTIFHRLSSLGSGGGVKAGTIPPLADQSAVMKLARLAPGLQVVLLARALLPS